MHGDEKLLKSDHIEEERNNETWIDIIPSMSMQYHYKYG